MKTAIIVIQHKFLSGKTGFVAICESTDVLNTLKEKINGNFLDCPIELASVDEAEVCDFRMAFIGSNTIEFADDYSINYEHLTDVN